MSKKIFYSTVMYKCQDFDVFIDDYLSSVFDQTDQAFELLILIDDADEEVVRKKVERFNLIDKVVHIYVSDGLKKPVELRKELIDISYTLKADILVFSDFDENVASNRVKEIRADIENYSFVFNDFYVVDSQLKRLSENSFFCNRDIPDEITDWRELRSCNYAGFGSLAINLLAFDYRAMIFPENIQALDWFVVTKVLLDGGKGLKLGSTYANYRQHENSFVGFDFSLNEEKLIQGLEIKKNHYSYFKNYNREFSMLYEGILDLENHLNKFGMKKYIGTVNSKFDTARFSWWENIKLLKEINNDI